MVLPNKVARKYLLGINNCLFALPGFWFDLKWNYPHSFYFLCFVYSLYYYLSLFFMFVLLLYVLRVQWKEYNMHLNSLRNFVLWIENMPLHIKPIMQNSNNIVPIAKAKLIISWTTIQFQSIPHAIALKWRL